YTTSFVIDHPVRSIKGGFAAFFLMSRPPLLARRGLRFPKSCSKNQKVQICVFVVNNDMSPSRTNRGETRHNSLAHWSWPRASSSRTPVRQAGAGSRTDFRCPACAASKSSTTKTAAHAKLVLNSHQNSCRAFARDLIDSSPPGRATAARHRRSPDSGL